MQFHLLSPPIHFAYYKIITGFFHNSSLESSGWSGEGVSTERVERDGDSVSVQCSSNHLTSFAVLVDVAGTQNKVHTEYDRF